MDFNEIIRKRGQWHKNTGSSLGGDRDHSLDLGIFDKMFYHSTHEPYRGIGEVCYFSLLGNNKLPVSVSIRSVT